MTMEELDKVLMERPYLIEHIVGPLDFFQHCWKKKLFYAVFSFDPFLKYWASCHEIWNVDKVAIYD